MIEVKVDTATPRSPSSSTNCEKGSTMIGQRTRPHPLDGPAKRGLRNVLDRLLESDVQVSTAVAQALVAASRICQRANPSDLWQHVIYRHLLNMGWNDNRWKRVSGFALERALVAIYEPRLVPYGLRMQMLPAHEANRFLATLDADIKATKVDLFLERETADGWRIFGAAHVKASIAERIQDDVPASQAFMDAGLVSIALTLDAKSFPPPHGDCVNYGT